MRCLQLKCLDKKAILAIIFSIGFLTFIHSNYIYASDLLNADHAKTNINVSDEENILKPSVALLKSTSGIELCDYFAQSAQHDASYNDIDPASQNGFQILPPEVIEFYLDVALQERAGNLLPEGFEANGNTGIIRFEKDTVLLNGVELSDDNGALLKNSLIDEKCADHPMKDAMKGLISKPQTPVK